MIRAWRPWERSTGPRTEQGKATSSRNRWQGGYRPLKRLLLARLEAEFARRGPDDPDLVELLEMADAFIDRHMAER